MEIESFIKKMKDIYSQLMDFFDTTDACDFEFKELIDILEKHEILPNQDEVQLLFQLISKIADNYHRTPDFFEKLEKIFRYLFEEFPSPISYFIPNYTNFNNRVLFLLLEKKLIKPDESFINQYLQCKPKNKEYYYLYPKMKEFLEKNLQKQIEEEIFQKYSETISTFEEKCQIGENDSYICSLIRSDSVEDFIAYVSRTNLSLTTKIKPSIYETNSFLIDKEPTLIEYAAFFGSIQIIRYLKYNNVPLTSSLWLYTIHSNNAELIHFLEENDVKPERNNEESFDDVLIESFKCHHNAITNYIIENFYDQIQTSDLNHFYGKFSDTIVNSLNFFFVPNEIKFMICKPGKEKGFVLSQLCFFLTTITIPSSVTSIGNDAFSRCSSLTQITIPSSVTSIQNYAFSSCSSLAQITIPSSVTSIGKNAFLRCSSLTQITIPSSVTEIGDSAFSSCSSLTHITIPSSITKIRDSTFKGCSSLTQITIPSSVKSIGNYAFSRCLSLTEITIPSSVTKIGNSIFDGVKTLEMRGNIQHIPNNLFLKCLSLTQITIPSSVTKIGDDTFSGCSSLTKITIPSSVTKIGDDAFSGCSSLTKITIPSSVTEIGNNVFSGCNILTNIEFEIPSSLKSIGKNCFEECKSLTRLLIPSSVTSYELESFEEYKSLTQITIPSSVTSIGENSFRECSSLTQITIPSSVTSIGNDAFSGCSSLTQITIPSSVTSIGKFAFWGCSSLTQITIPSSVTSIGKFAFSSCSSLTQITIPSSVTSIGKFAFNGCSSLRQITIPSSIDTQYLGLVSSAKINTI